MAEPGLAQRIEAATPAGRDRGIDALRAVAIGCIVLGHWLGTAWELNPYLVISSPLAYLPGLAPATWVFQLLSVFFLVGGYVAARRARPLTARLRKLLLPVVPLLLAWAVLAVLLVELNGQPLRAVRVVAMPALGPLWFLAVYTALTLATPLLVRAGYGLVIAAVCVVAAADAGRFWLGGPQWLGWVNVVAAWAVPYQLGVIWGRGGLRGRGTALALLAGGFCAAVALVAWAGYPVSMVGVTGAPLSNLSPPTLAATCFAVGQVGLALLLKDPLARLMRRPRLWAAAALVNLEAMWIFLWHQTALVLVVVVAFQQFGRPDSAGWILQRLALIPLFAGTLGLMTWCRHRFDGRTPRL